MTLNDFLSTSDLSMTRLAREVDTTTATISRIADGQVIPRRSLLLRICEVTKGAVTPCELLQLEMPYACHQMTCTKCGEPKGDTT